MLFRKFAGLFRLHFVSRNDDLGSSAALGLSFRIIVVDKCRICELHSSRLLLQMGRAETRKCSIEHGAWGCYRKTTAGDSGALSAI